MKSHKNGQWNATQDWIDKGYKDQEEENGTPTLWPGAAMNQKEQDTTRMARSMESLRISSGLFQLRAYKVVPKLVKVTPISLLGLW